MSQSDVMKLLGVHKEMTSKEMVAMLDITSINSSLKKMIDYNEVKYREVTLKGGQRTRLYSLV